MAKNKISEFSSTPANNTDIGGIDIAEGCAPSGINNAIRELMAQLKDQQVGTDADNFTVGGNLTVTGTTTATGAITATGGVTGNVTGATTGAHNGSVGATTPSTIVATTLNTASLKGTSGTVAGDGVYYTIVTTGDNEMLMVMASCSTSGKHTRATFVTATSFGSTSTTALCNTNYNGQGQIALQWSGNNLQIKTTESFSPATISYSYIYLG
jgi:hypothetical protein